MDRELINSKAIREYLGERECELTEAEEAAYIYQNELFGWKEKNGLLKTLAEKTENFRLRNEILNYLKAEQEELEAFQQKDTGWGYAVYVDEKDIAPYFAYICTDYQAAVEQGMLEKQQFHILKVPILEQGIRKKLDFCRKIYFDREGDIENVNRAWRREKREILEQFEGQCCSEKIEIPNPFRCGDIIQNLLTGEYGIVGNSLENPAGKISVAFWKQGKWKKAEMVASWLLEYAELPKGDIRWEVFLAAKRIMCGGAGGLEQMENASSRWNLKQQYENWSVL